MSAKFPFFTSFLLLLPASAFAQTQYDVSALPAPAGSNIAVALAASSNGTTGFSVVEGTDPPFTNVWQPALWQGSQVITLPVPQGYLGEVLSLNNNGDAVGSVWSAQAPIAQPAIWQNGQIQLLGTSNMSGGSAYAINSSGVAVGNITNFNSPTPLSFATAWTNGQPTILGNFPDAQATAFAVNNSGQIVVDAGYSDHSEAWVWSNGTMIQIPSLGGTVLAGYGINNQGDVVGCGTTPSGATVGFLWKNGVITPLCGLPGEITVFASAINNSDQIVGGGFSLIDNSNKALLWVDDQVFDLNALIPPDSGWLLQDAVGINDDGVIVGNGVYLGQAAAFMLTPDGGSFALSSTPEPTTLPLLALAALPLLTRRRQPR